jgi:hypothetical protein
MFGRVTSVISGSTFQFEYSKTERKVYLQVSNGGWICIGTFVNSFIDAKSIAQNHVDTQGL